MFHVWEATFKWWPLKKMTQGKSCSIAWGLNTKQALLQGNRNPMKGRLSLNCDCSQGCQMVYFQTKKSQFGSIMYLGSCRGKYLYILRPFGLFYPPFGICILWPFETFYGHFSIFFPVSVCCTNINLATLVVLVALVQHWSGFIHLSIFSIN
jgi:hypothetical protein